MWQAIQGILTDGNFLKSVIGIGALVVLLAFLAKKGIISFKGKGLKIGHSDEEERTIIRTQIQWCEADCKDMLRELVSLGSKVTTIAGYAFNNCHCMRGVMNLPNVTSIGGYDFGTTLGITDFILPSMTRLVQESFYAGPSPTQIHADNVQQIDSRFWEYYGGHLTDMYIRGKTRAQIKAMGGFPFYARGAGVRFHGSDGIVLANGTFV